MPGLAIKIKFDGQVQGKKCLTKISKAYKVPTLNYNEKYISTPNSFFYSLVPDFIKEGRLGQFFNDRYIAAIDGDYYNQEKINEILNIKNCSKLETILYLYLEKGDSFADFLNGEFDIVIYDTIEQNIIITNDKFARRTFYFTVKNNYVLLSSEKKGIIALCDKKMELDNEGILEVFTFRHNLNGKTFIKDLHLIKPATFLKINKKQKFEKKYFIWKFNTQSKPFNKKRITKEIHFKLKDAIKRRIFNKELILLWLSGGYDSRAIACSIDKDERSKILTRTFGEKNSEELDIAQKISRILKFDWKSEKVKSTYIEAAKFGAWRTEFAFSVMGHPFIGNHRNFKPEANYILSGLPGLDVLNGSFINLGKIIQSSFNNYYNKWYESYTIPVQELSLIFNKSFLKKYSNNIKNNFYNSLNDIKSKNKLDKWDIFIITQRQPNYSNISDLFENDLFETLHPFCDTDLLQTFLSVPLKKRMFMQLSKDFLYENFPEVRNVKYDERGKLKRNNSLLNCLLSQIKLKICPSKKKSIIWDKSQYINSEFDKINTVIKSLLNMNSELNKIFNYKSIYKILSKKENTLKHSYLIDTLITFLFSYQYLLKTEILQPPKELIENYINVNNKCI